MLTNKSGMSRNAVEAYEVEDSDFHTNNNYEEVDN